MDIEIDYFRRREAREQQLADAAVDPAIANIHRALADTYRQRIEEAKPLLRA